MIFFCQVLRVKNFYSLATWMEFGIVTLWELLIRNGSPLDLIFLDYIFFVSMPLWLCNVNIESDNMVIIFFKCN